MVIEPDGSVNPGSLDRLVNGLRAELRDESVPVVVLVHGFNTSVSAARRQYGLIAAELRAQTKTPGSSVAVVGVHWASHPGPLYRWLPQILGYRFLRELGFRRSITNPYKETLQIARTSGRSGLRAILFRLENEFKNAPLHVFSHSMGSELIIRALAPESGLAAPASAAIEQPERRAQVGLVCLAGADLDHNVFAPGAEASAQQVLPHASVWWFTVPRENTADAVLELRRGAGSRDAIGNRGLSLTREDFNRLMERRALVVDDEFVPISHDINAYYGAQRVTRLAAAIRYLGAPSPPTPSHSLLATLDETLRAELATLAAREAPDATSARLYRRW
ncbi:MAG TPA: alpha/beta hydrolase, partial [Armatimonadota bacterium]|nr:alpha/beta hydrolase [Armatimonadota bacterium]